MAVSDCKVVPFLQSPFMGHGEQVKLELCSFPAKKPSIHAHLDVSLLYRASRGHGTHCPPWGQGRKFPTQRHAWPLGAELRTTLELGQGVQLAKRPFLWKAGYEFPRQLQFWPSGTEPGGQGQHVALSASL